MKKMKSGKFKITNKGLYWALILTFAFLYLFVGFVSTLHSITFFNLANTMSLAILLGITYEIGQASVLFSILMTKNRDRFLPWALMFLLTALQVTANVYASFRYMVRSGSDDWIYWQKSILIGVQAQNAEMYQVIISWIAGALLPIIALGMTALVAQNIKLMTEENTDEDVTISDDEAENAIKDDVARRFNEYLAAAQREEKIDTMIEDIKSPEKNIEESIEDKKVKKTPITKVRGWHFKKEYIDSNGDVYSLGEYTGKTVTPPNDEKESEKNSLSDDIMETINKPEEKISPDILIDYKVEPIKDIDELIKPSRGDEVIALIEKQSKDKLKEPITDKDTSDEMSSKSLLIPPELLTPYIDDGVEVIDAKAVPTPKIKKNKENKER